RYLAHEPVRARRPSLVDRALKSARRNKPAMAMAAVIALVALTGLGGFAFWRDGMLRRHNGALEASPEVAKRKEWTNRRLLYNSRVRLAQQELSSGQVDFVQESL